MSGSCHPHHHGTQALTTSAYLGRLFVFVHLEALSTRRALVPSGCSPALAQRIPPSIRAVSPSSWPMSPPHVYENETQPAARSPEPSPLHPLLHDVWPVRFGLFVLYRGCRLDGLRRSSGSSRSLTARVACSVSSLLALHSVLSFTLLKAWSRARRMDCPAAKRITSHTLPAYVLEHCMKRMRKAGAGAVREATGGRRDNAWEWHNLEDRCHLLDCSTSLLGSQSCGNLPPKRFFPVVFGSCPSPSFRC